MHCTTGSNLQGDADTLVSVTALAVHISSGDTATVYHFQVCATSSMKLSAGHTCNSNLSIPQ